jgi:hypothetical protein
VRGELGLWGKSIRAGDSAQTQASGSKGFCLFWSPRTLKYPAKFIDSRPLTRSISLVLSCYLQALVTLVKSSTIEDDDLLMVADGTVSMGPHLKSLNASLPQIISISAITECFSSIGIKGHPRICRSFMMRGGRSLPWRVVTLKPSFGSSRVYRASPSQLSV